MHLGPWKLPIILLSAAMLCATGALINFCRKMPQPPVEVVDEHYSARCPRVVPVVLCCLSGLLFTVAAILLVKHPGHIHMPKHFPGFRPHHDMHLGPWKLPIILLSAMMLCGTAALMHFCRKVAQRGQAVEDGQSLPRSKYLKGAAVACFLLGVL